jgi:hypothetical protein
LSKARVEPEKVIDVMTRPSPAGARKAAAWAKDIAGMIDAMGRIDA